jgi:hypothetical protein
MRGIHLATAILAVSTTVLLWREITRPDVTPTPRAAPETVVTDRPPPVPEKASVDEREETVAEPTKSSLPVNIEGEIRDVAIRVLLFPDPVISLGKRIEALSPRAEQLLPVLEGWLRRREELSRAGLKLEPVLRAYGRLGGKRAIPLIEEILGDEGYVTFNRTVAVEILGRMDDPAATEAVRRTVLRFPPNHMPAPPWRIWYHSDEMKTLVREWAENPPLGRPRLREQSRETLFVKGTWKEKEAIWLSAERTEIGLLARHIRRHWPAPWPERWRKEVEAGLAGTDPNSVMRALGEVFRDPRRPTEAMWTHAERAVETALASDAYTETQRKRLLGLRGKFMSRRVEAERRRSQIDLLGR